MSDISLFEEYIPTDKWSLQDWYLSKVVYLDRLFSRLVRSSLSGSGIDHRSMIDFGAAVISYHNAASKNFEKFLSEKDYEEFKSLLPVKRDDLSYGSCFRLMDIISSFHWRSGLTKLGESRAIGSFAKARSSVGISLKEDESQNG